VKLEVREAHCGYEKGKTVQRYVSFTVESGQVCCVLGPNGCGKSTVFKSILGLVPLQSGKVTIDGDDISKWSPKRMADTMAYVSQNHRPPFPYQVKDVVLLGRVSKVGSMGQPTAKDYQIVENAMVDMGVYHLRDKVYTDISGGELQLVMIARALAQQPQVLVLDEPTAALDYGNVVRVIDKVRDLAKKGYAVIMTTHSPDHAFMCDSNVVLLQKDNPMKFGAAVDIITERNMKQAYGVNVKIVEFVNTKGEIMRMCSPVF
jgi:iron complex transport system ATP-binding protein